MVDYVCSSLILMLNHVISFSACWEKNTVVTSWVNSQNDNSFHQNDTKDHFEITHVIQQSTEADYRPNVDHLRMYHFCSTRYLHVHHRSCCCLGHGSKSESTEMEQKRRTTTETELQCTIRTQSIPKAAKRVG